MLTKEDKKYLHNTFITKKDSKQFSTKNDLKRFATKQDLKRFATKNDLKRFATKDDLKVVIKDVAELKVDSALMQRMLIKLEQSVNEVREISQKTLTIVEGVVGNVADLEQENKMGAITLRRHDVQIHELAHATSTKISE